MVVSHSISSSVLSVASCVCCWVPQRDRAVIRVMCLASL